MREYHKINTLFKRDEKTKRIVEGDWADDVFQYLESNDWEWTEKVDGTNIRVMWDGANVTFGGKTDNAQIPVKLLYSLQAYFEGTAKRALLAEVLGTEGGVCLYGEGYGASIQKVGALYRPDTDFVLFDIRIGELWLERHNVRDIAEKLGLPIVPVVGFGPLSLAIEHVRAGFKSNWGDFAAEGLVLRPTVPLLARNGRRIIAKIKTRDFAA